MAEPVSYTHLGVTRVNFMTSLLIICNGAKVGRTIQRIAEEMGVAIM